MHSSLMMDFPKWIAPVSWSSPALAHGAAKIFGMHGHAARSASRSVDAAAAAVAVSRRSRLAEVWSSEAAIRPAASQGEPEPEVLTHAEGCVQSVNSGKRSATFEPFHGDSLHFPSNMRHLLFRRRCQAQGTAACSGLSMRRTQAPGKLAKVTGFTGPFRAGAPELHCRLV